jgi:hypothetical protein
MRSKLFNTLPKNEAWEIAPPYPAVPAIYNWSGFWPTVLIPDSFSSNWQKTTTACVTCCLVAMQKLHAPPPAMVVFRAALVPTSVRERNLACYLLTPGADERQAGAISKLCQSVLDVSLPDSRIFILAKAMPEEDYSDPQGRSEWSVSFNNIHSAIHRWGNETGGAMCGNWPSDLNLNIHENQKIRS